MKKVLVTGAAGYIGSVLTRELLGGGYFVRGLDCLNSGGESLLGVFNYKNFEFIKGDIRKRADLKKAVAGMDHIVHLAAIVGDPACAKNPSLARATNWRAAKMLFDLSNESGKVKRFVFASTCSNYGRMSGRGYVNEESALKPLSLYAELKVKFEQYMLKTKTRKGLRPVSLRFATAFGLSPRMRFDLTVNEFVKDAFSKKALIIYGEQFWRPYCHINDLARACAMVLDSAEEKIDHQVFGVGDTKENYQKKMLAEEILGVMPHTNIRYVHKDEDPRDYRVDFSKIRRVLGYRITRTVGQGIREIHAVLKNGLLLNPDSSCYRNVEG